jgi:metal-dependent HD superfamily phosphatase/phosphodiesterase
VQPIDPIAVTKITIEEGAGRPIRLNLEFHNVKTTGFSVAEVNAVR